MSLRKIEKSSIILILLISVSFFYFPKLNTTYADMALLKVYGWGGFLIENGTQYLQMKKADVLFEIDSRNESNYKINFHGSYLLYNHNDTVIAEIVAPFSYVYTYYDTNFENTLTIKQNGTNIPHLIFDTSFGLDTNRTFWEQYTNTSSDEDWWFVILSSILVFSNITLESNTFSNITYSFSSSFKRGPFGPFTDKTKYYSYSNILFDYIVGTSRAWMGNITETVTMEVKGEQPDNYRDYNGVTFNKTCEVIAKPDMTSYIWKWENERINENSVWIHYDYKTTPVSMNFLQITIMLLVITLIFHKHKFLNQTKRK
jgi:hypothetical protein